MANYWLLEHCKKIDNDMGPKGPTAQSNVTVKKLVIISLRNKIIGCFSRTLQEGYNPLLRGPILK